MALTKAVYGMGLLPAPLACAAGVNSGVFMHQAPTRPGVATDMIRLHLDANITLFLVCVIIDHAAF